MQKYVQTTTSQSLLVQCTPSPSASRRTPSNTIHPRIVPTLVQTTHLLSCGWWLWSEIYSQTGPSTSHWRPSKYVHNYSGHNRLKLPRSHDWMELQAKICRHINAKLHTARKVTSSYWSCINKMLQLFWVHY